MKLKRTKLGFTLIELLVVITIIGILATGGVSVFTTQLQGARDSNRINDLKLMETSVHQYFSDNGGFPQMSSFTGDIDEFISKQLIDPKKTQSICWSTETSNSALCEGVYDMGTDTFGLADSSFKLGVRFEKLVNFKNKSTNDGKEGDGGNTDQFYEVYSGAGAGSGRSMTSGTVVY